MRSTPPPSISCLTLFPWAPFQRSKAAIKLHTLLDLRANIPAFIHITDARWHDAWVLDERTPEPGACLPSWTAAISILPASIAYRDPEAGKAVTFLSNDFTLPPLTIARLYKCRWQVELFFKWIKQHLRIKCFFGNTENAVKTQAWIAISVYVPVAVIKKRLDIDASLDPILQVLSVTVFERTPRLQMLREADRTEKSHPQHNQLNLFE